MALNLPMVVDIFNISGRGKVLAYTGMESSEMNICIKDKIVVFTSSFGDRHALVKGFEMIKFIDPRTGRRGEGAMLVEWIGDDFDDSNLYGSYFDKAQA